MNRQNCLLLSIPIFLYYCFPSLQSLVKYARESPEESTPHAALLFISLRIAPIDCKEYNVLGSQNRE